MRATLKSFQVAAEHKSSIARFWSTEDEAQGAFVQMVPLLVNLDSTAFKLKTEG